MNNHPGTNDRQPRAPDDTGPGEIVSELIACAAPVDSDAERDAIAGEPPLAAADAVQALAMVAAQVERGEPPELGPIDTGIEALRAAREAEDRAHVPSRIRDVAALAQEALARGDLASASAALSQGRALAAAERPPDLAALCRAMAERPAPARLATGLAKLDEACRSGIPAGKRVVLVGAPGAGKTALAVQWAHTWGLAGGRVVYLAMDQNPEAILVRVGEREGLDRDNLEGVTGPEAKRAAWLALSDRLDGLALSVLDGADVPLEAALAALRTMRGDGPRCIVLDSLQTIRCAAAESADTPRARMDTILDVLRAAAAEGILVLAVSEMARGGYVGGERSPTAALAAAKESGAIEYFADLLIALRSVAGESDAVDVEVAKNRLGERPELRLRIDRRRATLAETERPARADAGERARSTPEAIEQRILRAVRDHDIRTMRDLSGAVGGNWKATGACARAMLDRGALVKVGERFRPGDGSPAPASAAGEGADAAARVAALPRVAGNGNGDAPPSVAALPAPVGGGNGNGNAGGEAAREGREATEAIRAALASAPVASLDGMRHRLGRAVPGLKGAWDELRAAGTIVRVSTGRGALWGLAPPSSPPGAVPPAEVAPPSTAPP